MTLTHLHKSYGPLFFIILEPDSSGTLIILMCGQNILTWVFILKVYMNFHWSELLCSSEKGSHLWSDIRAWVKRQVLWVATVFMRLRVYSHLSCLVWLTQTQVRFPPWCESLGGCEYWNRTRVHTKQPYRDPAEEVVSVRFQTNSGTVEWMNQWIYDLKHTCGFVYNLWFTCKKGSVKANGTKQKKINIVWSGPKRVN